MKQVLIAAALMVFSVAAMAKGTVVTVDSNSVYKLVYKGGEFSQVNIDILDEAGTVVFSETIENAGGFVRPYNLEQLPAGTYTFRIQEGDMVETFAFTHKENHVAAHVKQVGSSSYFVTAGNPNGGMTSVRVVIEDRNGTPVYTEIESFDTQYAKVYNLKNVFNPGVTFKVISNNKVIAQKNF